jgi:uncharacterized membrane protein
MRVPSIDLLRGVVMVLMALDHTRDFIGTAANPVDIASTTIPLFFTRWITHLCAPTFFLLSGASAYLAGQKRSTRELSWHLFTRGLWLVLLELTVARCLGYQFNFDYRVTMLIILWALGWSMVVLAGLVYLPVRVVVAVGVLLIALHNLFDPVAPVAFGALAPLWSILHVPGFVLRTPAHQIFVAYPLVPWIGVMAVGYGLGRVFTWTSDRRRRFLLRAGLGLIAAFVVLRVSNIYGDPVRWTAHASAARTLLSFLNTNKYPPSLLFLLMTLGPALLILWKAESGVNKLLSPFVTFGRVPLFYFLLHIPLLHIIALVICYARYGAVHWIFESPGVGQFPFTAPPGWGYSLPGVYLVWIGVVLALYPLCNWFARVKRAHGGAWLSYL